MGKNIENYSLQSELGSGVYSKVYKGINNTTKEEVAVKMIPAKKFKAIPKLEDGIINEINILTSIQRSPHIVKYFDMLKTVNNFYFVYEFCNEGTLQKLISEVKNFSEKQAVIYFKQMIAAFKILNKHNIMHRDIKPENILLHNGIIKLADFGFCKPLESQDALADTMLGTPVYMAPQILRGEPYTMKADIWSLGTVLFKMLFGYCPFQSNNIAQLITTIENQELEIPQNPPISPVLKQLIKKMLIKNPLYRIQWSQIFQYDFSEQGLIFVPKIWLNYDRTLKNSTGSQKLGDPKENLPVSCKTSFSNSTGDYQRIQNSRNKECSVNGQQQNSSPFKKMDSSHKQYKVQSPKIISNMKNSENAFQKYNNNNYGYGSHSNHQTGDSFHHRSTHNTSNSFASINNGFNDRYSKINVSLKNHNKCIDLMNIAIQIAEYPYSEAIMLSYFFIRTVKQELLTMHESISREMKSNYCSKNSNMASHKQFIESFEQELEKIDQIFFRFSEQIPSSILNDSKQNNPKANLKKFVQFLKFEKTNQLILISQIIDYVEDKMLIKRSTYDKLTNEQMTRQIKLKMSKISVD